MSGRKGRKKSTYVADPERRAYLAAIRTLREQITREHANELQEAGLVKRILLNFRISREVKRRSQDIQEPPRQ